MNFKDPKILTIYKKLLELYGPQGWWPLLSVKRNYHPKDYSFPTNSSQIFEICLGAILTQNTNWNNVEKALYDLKSKNLLGPKKIIKARKEIVLKAIKPSGYFNQKYKKIINFSEEFLGWKGKTPSRQDLLNIWGIGPETADSILLYAYKEKYFVIDSYTKRIFTHLKIIDKSINYSDAQYYFEENLPKSLTIYQEYHALIVNHAKRFYSRRNQENSCPLLNI